MKAKAANRRGKPPRTDTRLAGDEPPPTAVRHLLARLLNAAWNCESGILAGADDEFLHRYRVTLRRARVLVNQTKGLLGLRAAQSLSCHLRAIARRTAPLRDLDVQLAWLHTLPDSAQDSLRNGFLAHLEKRHRREQRLLQRYLRSCEHQHHRERLREILDGPPAPDVSQSTRQFLTDRIHRRLRKLGKRAESTDHPDDGELHRIRIEAKKLRYLLEFGQGILPARQAATWIRGLRRVQDKLGNSHDLLVRLTWVQRYSASLAPPCDPAEQKALTHLAAALQTDLKRARKAAFSELSRFLSTRKQSPTSQDEEKR